MSIVTIRDTAITLLSASAYYGSKRVGKNYDILESAPDYGVVVDWLRVRSQKDALLGPNGRETRANTWTLQVSVYVKDRSTPTATSDAVAAAMDKLAEFVVANPTLNDTETDIEEMRASRTPGEARTAAGAAWLPFYAELDVTEWAY